MIRIDIDGLEDAMNYINKVAESSDAMGKTDVGVAITGRARLYSYGIEYGRKRSGGVARVAGGVFYVSRAIEALRPQIDDMLARDLEAGKDGSKSMGNTAKRLEAESRIRETAVRTGNLRQALHAFTDGPSGLGRA